ncbi:sialin-like, partial [Brachionus plicatilis]
MTIVKEAQPRLLFSVRFWLALLCFFLNAIHFMQRVNLSIAIVSMVNTQPSNETLINQSNSTELNTIYQNKQAFNWSKQNQGFLLSAISIGPFFTQIIGGWVALILGPKLMLFFSVLISSTLTIMTPISASFNFYGLLIVRILIGLAQGVVTSSLNLLWAHWAPPLERSTLLAISNSGSLIGNALTFLIGGFLCAGQFLGGWPSLFYLTGILGLVWCFIWILTVYDSPSAQKCITAEESNYILEKTAEQSFNSEEKRDVPWRKIFMSKSVLCLILSALCGNFGISLFTVCLPTYMKEILDFDIKLNGELCSIPFLSCWLFIILSGVFSDILIKSKKFEKINIRKLCNSIGFLVPAITFIGLIYTDSSRRVLGFSMILINISFSGFQYGSGYLVNFNDIGGIYSGIIYGVANTIGNLSAFLAPFLVGIITKNKTSDEWSHVFIISLVVYVVGSLVFLIFAKSETETWAKNSEDKKEDL